MQAMTLLFLCNPILAGAWWGQLGYEVGSRKYIGERDQLMQEQQIDQLEDRELQRQYWKPY